MQISTCLLTLNGNQGASKALGLIGVRSAIFNKEAKRNEWTEGFEALAENFAAMKNIKHLFTTMWSIIKQSFLDFIDNKVLKLSAALAFYTIFSLPAMLIIIISISDIFYGRDAIEGTLYKQIAGFVGNDAAIQIQEIIRNAALSHDSKFATLVGLVTLLIGATSVFTEIQDSINHIWKLKAKPYKGKSYLRLIINRLLSFSIVVALGFILLVSLVINGLMDLLSNRLTQLFPEMTVVVLYVVNLIITFLITSLLFGMIFKVLPDARIAWKHVRAGAFTTALLFMGGKFLIGFYLGQSQLSTTYGTAGSAIVLLLWVYYSAMILYLGAVFTHVYTAHRGSKIYPNKYAVWVQEIEVESEKSIEQQPETKTVIAAPLKEE